jgi:TRAP transporter 4TM/12TM fusion protein
VIFGVFIEKTKTGQFFTNLACRLASNSYGGPAKVAIISSGMFGSISGVGAANVYSTGVFTIPLMKRLGYPKALAGAIEATASIGGLMMPPIMGAGAFVMAEITQIPYLYIITAAVLPSCLYYISLLVRVHLLSKKMGLKGIGEERVATWRSIIMDSFTLLPIIGLLVMLVMGFSPFFAANIAIAICFLLSFLNKDIRMTPFRLLDAFRQSGQNMIIIGVVCAGAGMVVSVVSQTGLALGIAAIISNWSQGMLLPSLILIMLTCIALGMGLPCTPAYIVAVTVGGPALMNLGIDLLPAHLFVFYYAVQADITPPICVTTYCAASIADSDSFKTGRKAISLAILGFIVPFVFVYNDALLLRGPVFDIISVFLIMIIIIMLIGASFSGYVHRKLSFIERLLTGVAALALIIVAANKELMANHAIGFGSAAILTILLIRKIWNIAQEKNRSIYMSVNRSTKDL